MADKVENESRRKFLRASVMVVLGAGLAGCKDVSAATPSANEPTLTPPSLPPTKIPESTATPGLTATVTPGVTKAPEVIKTPEDVLEYPTKIEVAEGTKENIENWVNGKTVVKPLEVDIPGANQGLGFVFERNKFKGIILPFYEFWMQGVFLGSAEVTMNIPRGKAPVVIDERYGQPSESILKDLDVLHDRLIGVSKEASLRIGLVGIQDNVVVPVIFNWSIFGGYVWESPVYVFKNPPPGQFISKDQMQYGDGGFGSRSNYSLPVNLPENDLFKDFKVNRPFGFMMRILKERDFYGNIHQRSISSPGQPNMYYMEHICGAAKAMDDLAAGDLKSLKADGVEMSSIDDFNKLSSYQLLGLPQTFVYFPSK